jgi:hypothetical protein
MPLAHEARATASKGARRVPAISRSSSPPGAITAGGLVAIRALSEPPKPPLPRAPAQFVPDVPVPEEDEKPWPVLYVEQIEDPKAREPKSRSRRLTYMRRDDDLELRRR